MPAIALEIVATLAVVSVSALAVVRSYRAGRREQRELRSALMAEAEGRLARLMIATDGCGT